MSAMQRKTGGVVRTPTASQEAQKAPECHKVETVYGSMIDPFTQQTYGGEPTLVGEIKEGSWLDAQIKAGKLRLV